MYKISVKSIILFSTFYFLFSPVFAAEILGDLKESINKKTQTLQEVNQKILQTQQDLEKTEQKGSTLQWEIRRFDQNISQLNLNIRASEINIDKSSLEIEVLQYDIEEVEDRIDVKKEAVARFLREIQQRDAENTLMILLKNKSIAESFDEFQNLINFNSHFSIEVANLLELSNNLLEKLTLTNDKKQAIEIENRNFKNRKVIVGNQKIDKKQLLAVTKSQERVYQIFLTELEKQQAAIAEEIEELEEELRLTIDPSLLPTPRSGVLGYPVEKPRITQGYGGTNFARRAYKGRWHNGVDFGGLTGTPVFVAEDGKILEVWNQDKYCRNGAYGKFIVIEHPNNLTTMYAHLSLQAVKKGEEVKRGDLIGYIGSTGYAFGSHLHFTVYASQTFRFGPSKLNCGPIMPYGGDLDPTQYL